MQIAGNKNECRDGSLIDQQVSATQILFKKIEVRESATASGAYCCYMYF